MKRKGKRKPRRNEVPGVGTTVVLGPSNMHSMQWTKTAYYHPSIVLNEIGTTWQAKSRAFEISVKLEDFLSLEERRAILADWNYYRFTRVELILVGIVNEPSAASNPLWFPDRMIEIWVAPTASTLGGTPTATDLMCLNSSRVVTNNQLKYHGQKTLMVVRPWVEATVQVVVPKGYIDTTDLAYIHQIGYYAAMSVSNITNTTYEFIYRLRATYTTLGRR